jgi:ketosteroid isomerase-like protein
VSEQNVETVRRIHEPWARGDFSSVEWADPEIVWRSPKGLGEGVYRGVEAMVHEWVNWLRTFDELRIEALDYFDAGDQVVSFARFGGHGKSSGIPLSEIPAAARFVLRDGKVVELEIYTDRKQALRDAGIEGG